MEKTAADVEPVTVNDILGLDTWNRQRTSEELRDFINTKHDRLPGDIELF